MVNQSEWLIHLFFERGDEYMNVANDLLETVLTLESMLNNKIVELQCTSKHGLVVRHDTNELLRKIPLVNRLDDQSSNVVAYKDHKAAADQIDLEVERLKKEVYCLEEQVIEAFDNYLRESDPTYRELLRAYKSMSILSRAINDYAAKVNMVWFEKIVYPQSILSGIDLSSSYQNVILHDITHTSVIGEKDNLLSATSSFCKSIAKYVEFVDLDRIYLDFDCSLKGNFSFSDIYPFIDKTKTPKISLKEARDKIAMIEQTVTSNLTRADKVVYEYFCYVRKYISESVSAV